MSTLDTEPLGLNSQSLDVLRNRVASGEIVLFTGAGFSCDARAADGQVLPDSQELCKILWPIAFPGVPVDERSSLADIFDCAMSQSQKLVRETLEAYLRVDHASLPDFYSKWFSVPWARAYTLNIDDLEIAAERAFTLARPIKAVSASDPVPTFSHELTYVHLNGQLGDRQEITFSAPQYGRRLPGKDPWYATLAADILSRTVVFVGTTLDEPPLWQHLELRGRKARGRELRPRSFLVTPSLSIARKQMLKSFNIDHIAMDARQFAEVVLADMEDAVASGHGRHSRVRLRDSHGPTVSSVSELRQETQEINLGQYLRGREPTFRDVSNGFAIQRSFEDEILSDTSMLEPRVILVTGTAGTGKSTALLRLALSLDAAGKNVGWIDSATLEVGIPQMRDAIANSGYDYVIIDDVDLFAAQAGPLLQATAKAQDAPRIIAAARSTRAERFRLRDDLDSVDARFIVAPPLTDADIDALIGALGSAGLLGQLAGKTIGEQRTVFRNLAGRQLLVAMIEATSGRSFNDKIDDECSQLPQEQRLLYSVCALATRRRIGLEIDEILAAVGETSADQLERIDALKRQYLLTTTSDGLLTVRHRVIAERVVSWLRKEGQLAQPLEGLLFAMAVRYLRERNTASRAFRLMVPLLNHQFMIEEIADVAAVRAIYESLSQVLADDFHFWLQRGSFELEGGDLNLAENYLNQARGIASEDYRVRTAWSYMSLRRAAELAQSGENGWRERAEEAMAELIDIIEARGNKESHAFHILGSQSLHYVRRAPLSFEERLRLLNSLRGILKRGVTLHNHSDDLRQLRDDIEKEYLLLAVPTQDDEGEISFHEMSN